MVKNAMTKVKRRFLQCKPQVVYNFGIYKTLTIKKKKSKPDRRIDKIHK